MKKKSINSIDKGKRGEREAVKYLRSIGFEDAVRTQQYNGLGDSDVICSESLPNVHIEVKYGYSRDSFDIGTKLWTEAISQSVEDCDMGRFSMNPCVLWKPKRCKMWRLSFCIFIHNTNRWVTVAEDGPIIGSLHYTNHKESS